MPYAIFFFQISKERNLSKGKWLIFYEEPKTLNSFFHDVKIPLDCEFLVAQSSHDNKQVSLTEVYQVHHTLPLSTYTLGNWTPEGHMDWPTSSFMDHRKNLRGVVINTSLISHVCY